MMDVVSRRCQHHQCVRRPLYAMTGQRAMFCRTHKDPGMTDVVSRRCNYEVLIIMCYLLLYVYVLCFMLSIDLVEGGGRGGGGVAGSPNFTI